MPRWTVVGLLVALSVAGALRGAPRAVGASEPRAVDAELAAAAVSQERAAHALPPVAIDPRLMRIAALHARRMAEAGRLEHALPGEVSFARRFDDGDFAATSAAENIAGGPHSFSEALALWRASPRHEENLLLEGVSKLGVGVAVAPDSPYETYWSLVLAEDGGVLVRESR